MAKAYDIPADELITHLAENLKKVEPPVWLSVDKEKLNIKVESLPKDYDIPFDINMVVDYYSK